MTVRLAQLVRVDAPVWQIYYRGFESHQMPHFFPIAARMLVWIVFDIPVTTG